MKFYKITYTYNRPAQDLLSEFSLTLPANYLREAIVAADEELLALLGSRALDKWKLSRTAELE